MEIIKFYRTREEFGFLSNFWLGQPILTQGHVFRTSEHLYQALKVSHDPEVFRSIRDAKTCKEAAAIGRSASIRDDWDQARIFAMRLALLLKFEDSEARALLLDTGDALLVENTTSSPNQDKFWGAMDNGEGLNMLGKLLIEVRAFYRGLQDVSPHEEAAEISALQSEILARLRTPKYKVLFP